MFERGIEIVGTVRRNRIGKCPVMSESEIKKKRRGYFTEHLSDIEDVDISVVLVRQQTSDFEQGP